MPKVYQSIALACLPLRQAASQTLSAREKRAYKKVKKEPGDFPVGMIIGTVDIIDYTGKPGAYEWHLANPKRLKRPIKPDGRPNPAWFKAFRQ